MKYQGLYNLARRFHAGLPYRLGGGLAFPPMHVFIEVTYRCNLSCRMCQFFQVAGKNAGEAASRKELSADEITGFVGSLPPFTMVTFTGGELFVRKDINDILKRAAKRRRISIVTNGTLVDPDRAEMLVSLAPRGLMGKGLLLVDVSLEGREGVHESITGVAGSHGRTLRALETISAVRKKRGGRYPLLNIKTVITAETLGELEYLYELAAGLGVDIFNPMLKANIDAHGIRYTGKGGAGMERAAPSTEDVDPGKLREILERLTARSGRGKGPQIRFTPPEVPVSEMARYYGNALDMADYRCLSPWAVAAVSAYGDVMVCPYFTHGNIRERSFREIWNGEGMRGFRGELKKRRIFPGCAGCCNMAYSPLRKR